MELIFAKSQKGKRGVKLPKSDVPINAVLHEKYTRKSSTGLPNVSEPEVVRHYTCLSQQNFGVDSHFYPLGSCTMKYNPKITEKLANMENFTSLHPLLPQLVHGGMLTQGALELVSNLEEALSEITGMDAVTTQPMAGAHGELTGVMLISAYHQKMGNKKKYIIIPDSGHGTNPASASIGGYAVKTVKSDANGFMDLQAFEQVVDDDIAAVMITCPNTLGVFNAHIKEIVDLTHKHGGLMYYDGANLNAIMGKVRPGDLGFDVIHLNLHKTFATPHGGGGPGSGPVGVKKKLIPFLPISRVVRSDNGTFVLDYDCPDSIGYIAAFYGNFGVMLKAYAYILQLGADGLTRASEIAVLNANYLLARLKEYYDIPSSVGCLHEFVISAKKQAVKGASALDIAKALIDNNIHPPTIYFPLIIKEAMMIEPTETESKATLDNFIEVMINIAKLADEKPEIFHDFPVKTAISRPDEVAAARKPNIASLE